MPNPTHVASGVLVVVGSLAVPLLLPAAAGALPLARPPSAAPTVQLAGYGDGSGAHRHGHRRAATSRTPDAAVPDLHGATRDDADKAYRKKYGF